MTCLYLVYLEEALPKGDLDALVDESLDYGEVSGRAAFVLEFIGRANMFAGELGAHNGRPVLRAGALTLAVPEASAPQGRAFLATRPERVRLCMARPAGEGKVVSAKVTNIVYLGSHAHYYVRLVTGEQLVALQSAAEGPAISVDARVWVTWRTEDVRVVPA